MNNPIFKQFNNMPNQNVNPAMYKIQLTNKLREMQSSGVNPDEIIKQGITDGKINQQQVDTAYNIARNVARNLFGYSGQ